MPRSSRSPPAARRLLSPALMNGYRAPRLVARGRSSSRFEVTHADAKAVLSMKAFTGTRSPSEVQALLDRAHAVSMLRGPHIGRVLDAGCLDGGEPFVVSELLVGTDLATLVRCGSPLSIADAVR